LPIATPHDVSGFLEEDDRVVLDGPGGSVVFARAGERWTHSLLLAPCGELAVAQAVESTSDERSAHRVATPVYQDLQRHELAAGSDLCVLLTGRFFQHHFSAAVTLRLGSDDPGTQLLEFDIADRCRGVVEMLAATYLVRFDSSALSDAGPQSIVWTTDPSGRQRLELSTEPPGRLVLAEAGRQGTRVQAIAALTRETFTHRLRYQWRWTSACGLTR
jgi:hypothetical protein